MRSLATAVFLAALPVALGAQVESYCRDAHAFLAEVRGMAAVAEPHTLADWRTGRSTEGCQVTAAGLTRRSPRAEARAFFADLEAQGWTRTPDPRDAPNESSLRFRRGGHDCLFSFYTRGLLTTEAAVIVEEARVPGPGETRYGMHVMCVPAAPARVRPDTLAPPHRSPGQPGPPSLRSSPPRLADAPGP